MLDTKKRHIIQKYIDSVAKIFIKFGFSANAVSIFGLLIGICSAIFLFFDFIIVSIILLWLSGLLDVIDGSVARLKGSTAYGVLLDIMFDRLVEIAIILVIAIKIPQMQLYLLFLSFSMFLCMTAFLTVGILVDKHSMKSFYYAPGIMERTETFIMLSLFIVLPNYIKWLIIIFTILILYTAIQRVIATIIYLKNKYNRAIF